jgi:hypothetical protein
MHHKESKQTPEQSGGNNKKKLCSHSHDSLFWSLPCPVMTASSSILETCEGSSNEIGVRLLYCVLNSPPLRHRYATYRAGHSSHNMNIWRKHKLTTVLTDRAVSSRTATQAHGLDCGISEWRCWSKELHQRCKSQIHWINESNTNINIVAVLDKQ